MDTVAERTDITLSDAELFAITEYKRAPEQLAELHRQGFHRARLSRLGHVILERAHYEAVCAGQLPATAHQARPPVLP